MPIDNVPMVVFRSISEGAGPGVLRVALLVLLMAAAPGARAQTGAPPALALSLRECITMALLRNRDLQIERVNPGIAKATLSGSYGYYDPLLVAEARQESATDTGGFDPADFSRDAIYSADSEIAGVGLTGVLPTGMSYALMGDYANSYGQRNGLDFDSYKVVASVFARQPLLRNLWIDQGRMTIQVNKRNLKITELAVAFVTMDIINQVQQAYYELHYARENFSINENLLHSRQQLLTGVLRKIEEGMAAAPDEQLARAQLAVVESALITSSNIVVLAENALKSLIGDDFHDPAMPPLRPTDRLVVLPEVFNLAGSWQRGLASRPDLAQLREDVEKARIGVRFARNQLFPSLDLVAGYGRRGASTDQVIPPAQANASAADAFEQIGNGSAPNDMVGLVLTIPLSRASERANFRVSKQLKEQALLRVVQREEQVRREIADALHTAENSYQQVTAARRAREFSQAAATAEEQKLIGGKSTIFFVLQVQDDLARAQIAEVRARVNYNRAVSQLRFAEGSLLETHGISLSID